MLAEVCHMNTILFNSELSVLFDCSPDGILAVDQENRIVAYNRRFAELMGIPKNFLDARNDDQILQLIFSRLECPEELLAHPRELPAARTSVGCDEIRLKDGRLLERYSASYSGGGGKF